VEVEEGVDSSMLILLPHLPELVVEEEVTSTQEEFEMTPVLLEAKDGMNEKWPFLTGASMTLNGSSQGSSMLLQLTGNSNGEESKS